MSFDLISAVLGGGGGAAIVTGVIKLVEIWQGRKEKAAALVLDGRKLEIEDGHRSFADAEATAVRISKEQADLFASLKDQLTETLKRVKECDERSDAQDKKADERAKLFEEQIEALRKKAKQLADQHDECQEDNRRTRHELANLRHAHRIEREALREHLNLPPGEITARIEMETSVPVEAPLPTPTPQPATPPPATEKPKKTR